MAQVKVKDMQEGRKFWIIKYEGIKEITIDSPLTRDNLFFVYDEYDNISRLFVRDLGVRPLNYDNRPTQVFFTRDEAIEANTKWAGQNPNFLNADESENT